MCVDALRQRGACQEIQQRCLSAMKQDVELLDGMTVPLAKNQGTHATTFAVVLMAVLKL